MRMNICHRYSFVGYVSPPSVKDAEGSSRDLVIVFLGSNGGWSHLQIQ